MGGDLTEDGPGAPPATQPDRPPLQPPPPPSLPRVGDKPPEPPLPDRAEPARAAWRRVAMAVIALVIVVAMVAQLWPTSTSAPAGATWSGTSQTPAAARDPSTVAILAGAPSSIDPARHGDITSAAYVSQLYESLTAVDAALEIRPSLAESWAVEDQGRRVVFTLREGLTFSDGTPLTADDVVRSWRRVFSPTDPSPLASLAADIRGARDLLAGRTTDITALGVQADGDGRVVVDLERGGGDLPAIVSGAPFAIVPPSVGADIPGMPVGLVGSGGYLLDRVDPDAFVLKANPRYWAGKPAIDTVRMLTTLDGRSPVDAFVAGDVDVTPIGYNDAGWIAYDRDLGPALRSDPDLSVVYYGFDTTRPPFDDARVRRAFAQAVDWRRLARLDEPGSSVPATGMVPAGIPGTPAGDYLPPYDPAAARALLAQAGYPDGQGLAPVSFVASGGGYDAAIVAMLRESLGVDIDYSTMDFDVYQALLAEDPPQMWSLGWVADYPGPNDFLGVLLETGSTANQGGWSNPEFDAAIEAATSAADPAAATAAYARAMELVRDEVPAVPVSYGTSFSLVRDGLLGANQNGTGILRLAGLAWEEE